MFKRTIVAIVICIIAVIAGSYSAFAAKGNADGTTKSKSIDVSQYADIKDQLDRVASSGSTDKSKMTNYVIKDSKGNDWYVSKGAFDIAQGAIDGYERGNNLEDDDSVADAKNQVRNLTNNLNMHADVGTASLVLSGLQPFITTVLGIMVWIVTAGMTIFTVCDLCYIYFPAFREKTGEMAQSGNAIMSKTSKETGESKFRFVTDEAMYAVQTCSVETGKHPASVWIKKRVMAYILLGIALFILLTGNITLIVDVVLNVVGGVISALQSFGA